MISPQLDRTKLPDRTKLKTFLHLRNEHKAELPEEFHGNDVRYSEGLVERFILDYSKNGDVVFDPFMGYGTTLVVAERFDRKGYGIEFDERRWQYCRNLLQHPERALNGDSRKLSEFDLPPIDFSITSPPYMGSHHREDPLTNYSAEFEIKHGYKKYLDDLASIYRQMSAHLSIGARVVIEVSNLKHELENTVTTLAWDIARSVSEVLHFEGEIIICWENGYGYGYDHSYCLLFSRD